MNRTILENFKLYLKGMVMGIADAFPGISGGTMALILGVYEELISSISNVNYSLFLTLKKEGLKIFWKKLNGNFLIILFSGVLSSLFITLLIADSLIDNYPILIWSFFLGLVTASIYVILKPTDIFNFNKNGIRDWILVFVSAIISYLLTTIPQLNSLDDSMIFLFFAGITASCAMILPGISGSYILIILGLYKTMTNAVENFEVSKILTFGAGVLLGLTTFSKVVKWGFQKYPNKILILMTGLIIGSIHKLWPWKLKDTEVNISPFSKDANYIIESIILFIIGFFLIFLLEKTNKNKNIEKSQPN
jgi:putative membrane protein